MQPFGRRARHKRWRVGDQRKEQIVFRCGYNGWADVPEEEREGLDVLEASRDRPTAAVALTPSPTLLLLPRRIPDRRAA